MVAIVFGIGLFLVFAWLLVGVLALNAMHDAEEGSGGVLPDRSAAEQRFAEAMAQAGGTAYVASLANPAADGKVLTYVFVPVEIARDSEGPVFATTELLPNREEPYLFEYCFHDASVIDAAEEAGYPVLHDVLYRTIFGCTAGTSWGLYAFDADSSAYWEPQVNFQVLDDEAQTVKSFTYHAEEVSLEELEAIARQHVGQEG